MPTNLHPVIQIVYDIQCHIPYLVAQRTSISEVQGRNLTSQNIYKDKEWHHKIYTEWSKYLVITYQIPDLKIVILNMTRTEFQEEIDLHLRRIILVAILIISKKFIEINIQFCDLCVNCCSKFFVPYWRLVYVRIQKLD